MKYQFIKRHSNEFAVTKICHVLNINRSAYYAWLKMAPSLRDHYNKYILERIRHYHDLSNHIYGYRRVYKDLESEGLKCNIKRVCRLMSENGIFSKSKKKFRVTSNSKHNYPVSKNLLNRNFCFNKKDKVWVSDITYISTKEGWLYLCVIIDLFSKQIAGWSMKDHMKHDIVIDAFNMAYDKRSSEEGLIFHSDRGVQYASHDFRDLLKSKKYLSSMSRKGNCRDNACAESFFHTLKTEEVYFNNYQTSEEAKRSVFYYIEGFEIKNAA